MLPNVLAAALQYHRAGDYPRAEQAYRQILTVDPNHVDALHLLGVVCQQTGRSSLAVDCMRHALRLHPGYAEAHSNLGIALQDLGRLDEAIASFRRAVELKPDFAEAHNYLGVAFEAQGNEAAAADSWQAAIRCNPGYADPHNNLGVLLGRQGKYEDAAQAFRRAVAQRPQFAEGYLNLGVALQEQGSAHEAAGCYEQALRVKPDYVEALQNLGNAQKDQGKSDQAIDSYRRAIGLQPDFVDAQDALLYVLQYRFGVGMQALADAHREYDRRFAAPLQSTWRPHANNRDPQRPLKIGFVSGDFVFHPVGYFLVRALECVDRRELEIHCYSNRAITDEMTRRFQAVAAGWHEVEGVSDEQLAERIRADRIDILVDLSGHSARNRLRVFARRPAPLQLTWIGYEGTTGLSAIDYIVADRQMIPPEAERYYSERVVRLPDSYVCFSPPTRAPEVQAPPAVRRGYVTFGSFNYPGKYTPEVFDAWAEILRQVPAARLVLKYRGWQEAAQRERCLELLGERGITAGRVEFQGWSPHYEMLSAYGGIDIALDPFPFTGGVTTCAALWMGVPVVTYAGETFASRHSLSYLSAAGFTETICGSPAEYVRRAVELAGNLTRLTQWRSQLRERVAASPLCDGPRFARNLTALLRGLWLQYCATGGRASSPLAAPSSDLAAGPEAAALRSRQGNELFSQGKFTDAAVCYRDALRLQPNHSGTLSNLGAALQSLGQVDEAIDCYERALALQPSSAAVHCNLGAARYSQGRLEESVACYREALRLQPAYAGAMSNLGIALKDLGRGDEATRYFREAVRLDPRNVEALISLGNALAEQDRPREAAEYYQQAIHLRPNHAQAHNNLGGAWKDQGNLVAAAECYSQAVRLQPEYVEAHNNLAMAWLLLGNFAQGWPEYEWRLRNPAPGGPSLPEPLWDGSPVAGRTILVHAEQGLGDCFQFIRFARVLKQRGATVAVVCPKILVALLSRCPYIDWLPGPGKTRPACDCRVPLLSLPAMLHTTLADLPAEVPYLFAEPERVARWRDELSSEPGLKIGISWQGSLAYHDDRRRSLSLAQFAPVAALPGARLFSLQKGTGSEQLAVHGGSLGIVDLASRLDLSEDAFLDTAAVMQSLDLVITSDTAVAHLAGALGVPVWVALSFVPDWRWMLEREDCPWYPTMRLFRQRKADDWPEVFQRIAAGVQNRILQSGGEA